MGPQATTTIRATIIRDSTTAISAATRKRTSVSWAAPGIATIGEGSDTRWASVMGEAGTTAETAVALK
jgi:hypothetical protein